MPGSILIVNHLMLGVSVAGWVVLGVAFLRRPRLPRQTSGARRDPISRFGILLGVAGFAVVWSLRRPPTDPPLGLPAPFHLVAAVLVANLVAIAIRLLWDAFHVLGVQWRAEAQVLSGHKLITTGPYAHVRHPIYAGLGALLLATGLALSYSIALLGGALLYGVGTAIRVRSEEALLRERFGQTYADYTHRVPAFVPRVWAG